MKTEILNSPSPALRVFRQEDGSLGWQGTFNGLPIKHAVPVDGEYIILLDPDASKQVLFKNLLRIDCNGDPKWFAELPARPDTFVDIRLEKGSLVARSWSGYKVRIDLCSGKQLTLEFVK